MSMSSVIPAFPAVERGRPSQIKLNPKRDQLVYGFGRMVILRDVVPAAGSSIKVQLYSNGKQGSGGIVLDRLRVILSTELTAYQNLCALHTRPSYLYPLTAMGAFPIWSPPCVGAFLIWAPTLRGQGTARSPRSPRATSGLTSACFPAPRRRLR